MTVIIKRSLVQHEAIIESGVKSFLDVGRSLMAIRDEKLYPKQFKTFEAYCKDRWGFGKSRAYQLIESAVVVRDVVSTNCGQIENEGQARAVAGAAPDAKTRAVIWKAAVASAPKGSDGKPNVTAAVVKKAAAAIVGEKPKPPGREPGDESETKPRPPKDKPPAGINTKLDFDDTLIEVIFGKLIRAIDQRADVLKQKHSAYHNSCVNRLGDFLKAFNEWKVLRR